LPNELYAFCSRSKTVSPSTVLTQNDPDAPPPQKAGSGGVILKLLKTSEEIISIKDKQSLIGAGKYLELR